VRGESTASTLSRELFAPIAGDITPIASGLLKQRRAVEAAKRQEERQLKLAALESVQKRQDQAYADDLAATTAGRQYLMMAEKKGATPSTDYTVKQDDGSFIRQPVVIEKDWRGNITYKDAGGKVIPSNRIGVYTKPKAGIKPSIHKATNIEVIVRGPNKEDGSPGELTYQPVNALITTTFKDDGSVRSTTMTEPTTGQVLVTSGPKANARMAPKPGSKTSLYYAPGKGTSIYLTENFAEAFGLPSSFAGAKAELQRFTPKPDLGKGLPELQKIRVGGKTYALQDHKNYNKETGNIDLDTVEGTVTYDASSLWRLEDPKAYVDVGDPLTVPSGSKLAEIRKINGLSQITSGEKLRFQRNAAGGKRVLYGKQTITLSPNESALFQVRDLSEVQQLDAGQTFRKFTRIGELIVPPGKTDLIPGSKVNEKVIIEKDQEGNVQYTYKGKRIAEDIALQLQASPLSEAEMRAAGLKDPLPDEPYVTYQNTGQITRILPDNREVGAGDTISLTATEYRNLAPEARDALRKTQPADAAGVRRMVTTAFEHDGIEYFPGDWRTDNNAAFAALPPAIQQSLSDDSDLKKETLKKEHFKSFWKQIVEQQVNSGLMEKASSRAKPSEGDLSALLAQFPTGRRGVGTLRQAILNMIQLAPTAAEVSAGTAETEDLSYGDSIQRELNDAKKRYDTLLGKGIISGNQRWENLSFESQRAFANVARGRINVAKINNQWEKAQQKLTALRKDFEIPDANEVAAFNSSARLLILLKDLRDSNDLSKTGRFWKGFFSKLGAEVFGDFRPLTSAPSKRLLSIITDMQASLKTLSGTEGVDGRPSNFRLQLHQGLLPAFNRPEALNEQNLNVIISKLENNIRGVFTPEIAGKYVIPRSFVRSAREAGLLKADVDPRRYPFVNPNEEGPPGVTRKDVLGAFGKHLYSLAEFEKLRVGRTLPADSRGRTLVKVSETEVQYALPNGMPDKKSPKFPAANMFQNAPVE
jgi:hypothetical protein